MLNSGDYNMVLNYLISASDEIKKAQKIIDTGIEELRNKGEEVSMDDFPYAKELLKIQAEITKITNEI